MHSDVSSAGAPLTPVIQSVRSREVAAMHKWQSQADIGPRSFKCKFCDKEVATRMGFYREDTNWRIYLCPNCARPTFFEGSEQIPAPLLGFTVRELPENIEKLYNEIRDCSGTNAFTAAVLACRKLLMHVAVEQGAPEGNNFLSYVEHLANKGFIPPHGREWVDHIRSKGNEANHQIVLMSQEDASDLINFTEMLLKFIYEFPKRLKK